MVQFETHKVRRHSIYSHLFIKKITMLSELGIRFQPEIVDIMIGQQSSVFLVADVETNNIIQQLQTEIKFTQDKIIGYYNLFQ